jgi:uncharacterized protein (DUF1330 family)
MSAYVVMIREKTIDPEQMNLYVQQALSARAGHAVTPIVRYGKMKVLEGPEFEGCLIHRFPTTEEAENWYNSPKYQAALKHRMQGAEYRVFIVEGLDN